VVAISNSYGGSDASDSSYGSYYNHPGIAVTVSSGDGGYGVEYPASSHYVTAVGGTHLTTASNTRGRTETAWSGAGSGCSAYNIALSGAATFNTGCGKRAVADVSAVADPATGVAVYDSTAYQGLSGWLDLGGTSVSSPIIASVYALAGNTGSIDNNYPYTHSTSLFDVTSSSNGSCTTTQWCNEGTGWDGPTGLGTPNGTGAF
jgi:subtilase family serine protease